MCVCERKREIEREREGGKGREKGRRKQREILDREVRGGLTNKGTLKQ